jgi:cephalosporin hydroxylase
MNLKIILLLSSFVLFFTKLGAFQDFKQCQDVYIYGNGSIYVDHITDLFKIYEIPFKVVDSIKKNDQHLYIIFDLFNVDNNILPQYYVAYQTLDLTKYVLTDDYEKKLSQAIVIWDFSRENIQQYRSRLSHYYFLPQNYEFAAAVFLISLLPVDTLAAYKDLVKMSNEITNTKFSPIASHLPILFVYSYLQHPKLIVEDGVEFAISTRAFSKVLQLRHDVHLFGIDINILHAAQEVYGNLNNASLLHMDDKNFYNFFMNTQYKNNKIDVVFIDTSHQYQDTLSEIEQFSKLLADNGILMFHDSNVTPDDNGTSFTCLNGDKVQAVWNPRGVPQAIKKYFGFDFDEYKYIDTVFSENGAFWHIIHYPFCNGLTIMRLLGKDKTERN